MTLTQFKDWFFNRYRLPYPLNVTVSNKVHELVDAIESSSLPESSKEGIYKYMKDELGYLAEYVKASGSTLITPFESFFKRVRLQLPTLPQIGDLLSKVTTLLVIGIIGYVTFFFLSRRR